MILEKNLPEYELSSNGDTTISFPSVTMPNLTCSGEVRIQYWESGLLLGETSSGNIASNGDDVVIQDMQYRLDDGGFLARMISEVNKELAAEHLNALNAERRSVEKLMEELEQL